MSSVSLSKGWWLFAKALLYGKPWSLPHTAALMFRLNVTARNLRRHPITDQIYELKNELIKYLYQHGYCAEVKLHSQKRICHACGGTGVRLYSLEDCWKCDGTGIFAVTQLYAFRFDIAGKRYAWHQLRKLVDYPVVLTDAELGPFVEPTLKDEMVLKLDEAWLTCCAVWWFLLFRGIKAELLLFKTTRLRIVWGWRTRVSPVKQLWNRLHLSLKQGSADHLAVIPDEDDIPF